MLRSGWGEADRGGCCVSLSLFDPKGGSHFSGHVAILFVMRACCGPVGADNLLAWIDLWGCSCYLCMHDSTSQYAASPARFNAQ